MAPNVRGPDKQKQKRAALQHLSRTRELKRKNTIINLRQLLRVLLFLVPLLAPEE